MLRERKTDNSLSGSSLCVCVCVCVLFFVLVHVQWTAWVVNVLVPQNKLEDPTSWECGRPSRANDILGDVGMGGGAVDLSLYSGLGLGASSNDNGCVSPRLLRPFTALLLSPLPFALFTHTRALVRGEAKSRGLVTGNVSEIRRELRGK